MKLIKIINALVEKRGDSRLMGDVETLVGEDGRNKLIELYRIQGTRTHERR